MSRNPLIFGLFTRMSLVEKLASGIPRMQEDMKKAGLPGPVFSTDEAFFTVEFKRPDDVIVNLENDPINIDDDPINLENDPINIDDDPVNPKNDPINLEEVVFQLIANNEGISAPDISKLIGKSLKTAKRHIAKLKKVDKIEYRGALKNGGYYLK